MLTEKQQTRMMTYLLKARKIAEKSVTKKEDTHLRRIIGYIQQAELEGCWTETKEDANE